MKQSKINIVIFAADAKHLSYLNNIISSVVFNKNIKKPVEIWDKQELKKLFPNLYKKITLN